MSLSQRLDQIKDTFLDLLFPLYYVGCGREGDLICIRCRDALPRIEPPWCYICGLPRSGPCVCGTNRSKTWLLDGLRSPFRFEGTIREAIHSLKYRNIRAIAGPLAEYLADYHRGESLKTDVLVAVPLHSKRLRERGYNQSELLARSLAKAGGLPLIADCLHRTRDTPPQARSTNVEERRANVARAFSCKPGSVTGKSVLIIDDVTTTGATLEACAQELKKAGAISVWALTVAREL